MAVTELALLRAIASPTKITDSASLLAHLKMAKDAMESFSGFSFTYYRCLEDPDIIILVGGWPSAKFHWEEWILSRKNQELLELLEEEVAVEWMFHVDLDREALEGLEEKEVVGIGRYRMREEGKTGFEETFKESKDGLENVIGESELMKGGWRVEKGFVKGEDLVVEGMAGEKEEWVQFIGLEIKDCHMAVAQKSEFEEYGRIGEWVEASDVKHGVKLHV